MKNKLLKYKIIFEEIEKNISKEFYSENYMNYGYVEFDDDIFFYYLETYDLGDAYILMNNKGKMFKLDNLLFVKIYDKNFKKINKIKYIIDLIFKNKNNFGYYT